MAALCLHLRIGSFARKDNISTQNSICISVMFLITTSPPLASAVAVLLGPDPLASAQCR